MALCFYKETFTLGFVSAFFVFAIGIIFEDALKRILEKINKFL